ncbi:MAG: aminoacyl-tRNA hydrolase [Polyangiales bacterium]
MRDLENPHDHPEAVRARSEQADPWVMYLVVRREALPSLAELLAAGAVAAVRCADQWRDHPTWREGFDAWFARSFRKVCLRASEKDWAKLQGYDQGMGHARGQPVVCALPPRTKSQRDKLLVNLQAFTTGAFAEDLATVDEGDAPMRLVRNDAVAMSAGKAVAQIAHASMHASALFARDHAGGLARWRAAGYPCALRRADAEAWTALKHAEPAAVVRDAGLTEVAPGSETFLALPPVSPGAWSEVFRGLPKIARDEPRS